MNLLLASFIFTTNNLATVLGPFAVTPPVGITCDTHKQVDLTRANWELRERCGWYDCDVSARPSVTSNEIAVIIGYVLATPPKHGYKAVYEVRRVPDPPGPKGEGVLLSDGTLKTTSGTNVPPSAVGTYDAGTIDQKISEATPQDYETVRTQASTAYSHTSNLSNPHGVSTAQIGAVPTNRTINGHALSSNFSLYASDVGAATPSDVSNAKQEVIEGGVFVTRTLTPDFLRSGRDGELGYGYSYSVSCADGLRRFGATASAFDWSLRLIPSRPDDPVVLKYGSVLSNRVSFVTEYTSVETPEYSDWYPDVPLGGCVSYSRHCTLTVGIPLYVDLAYSYASPYTLSVVGGGGSYLDTYYEYIYSPDGTTHYCYGFTAQCVPDMAGNSRLLVSYIDNWWSYYTSGEEPRSFYVALDATPRHPDREFMVFGDGGRLASSAEVPDMVRSYIQNNAIQKRVLKERTGLEHEYGTGWGYLLYDWTSDSRGWLLKVPRLDMEPVSTPMQLTVGEGDFRYGSTNDTKYSWGKYPANPMLNLGMTYSSHMQVVETRGCYNPDCVNEVDLTCGAWDMPVPGTTSVRTTPALIVHVGGLIYGVSSFSTTSEVADWLAGSTYVYDWTLAGGSLVSNAYTCVCSDFMASQTGIRYKVVAHVKRYTRTTVSGVWTLAYETVFTYYPTFGVILTPQSRFMEITTPGEKIATVSSSHWYWDPGLQCTFAIAVSNGCFYGKKVSDSNLTRDE